MDAGVPVVALLFLLVGVVLAVGWVVPLAAGVARMREGRGGQALTVVGAIWGVGAAGLVVLAVVGFFGFRSARSQAEATAFDPATHQGATATVCWPGGGSGELTLSDTETRQRQRVSMADGKGTMRTGTFQPVQYVLKEQDEAGVAWEARAWITEVSSFTLAEGGTHELQLGPPYAAEVKVAKQSSGQPTFSLKLSGSAGETCNFYKAGNRAAPPKFEVVDEEGEVAFSGKFEYG